MPLEFYVIVGVCIAIMGLSAFYLGDDNKQTRALARVGLVIGGSALFVSAMYYYSILIAVLIIMIPIALVVAWFNGLFS